jgi:HEAT repeat protein
MGFAWLQYAPIQYICFGDDMNRFVIYAFMAGILAGVFISLTILEKKVSQWALSYPKVSYIPDSTFFEEKLGMKEKEQGQTTKTPIPNGNNVSALPQDWSNVLLILEDAYRKEDWKGFHQTLEIIQADGKYPLPGIIGLLKNGFAQSAATSIQGMDTENALFIAESILKGNSSKDQKIEILRAIGENNKGVTPLLEWILENEKDIQLSSLALNAMGETKDPALIPFLSDYAKNQHELPLRLAAIEALGNFDSNAILPLEELLNAQTPEEGNEQLVLKSIIIETLGSIGNNEAVSLLSNLARMQEDSEDYYNHGLREDAIAALGDVGSPEALTAIGEIIADEGMDVESRSFALDTLVKAKKDESFSILTNIINDGTIHELEIKKSAIGAFRDIKRPEAVTFLAELITRPNNEIPVLLQTEALSAIGQIGDPETVPILENIINSEYVDMEVREDAIYTLGKVGTETAVPVLERIVNDTSDPVLTRAALRGLQRIGSGYSISIIEGIAQGHPSYDIRRIASKLLEVSNHPR